eukprot:XP_001609769.1 hypothetical protein [Babesia bovis T2Bo]
MDDLGYEWYTGFRTPRAVADCTENATTADNQHDSSTGVDTEQEVGTTPECNKDYQEEQSSVEGRVGEILKLQGESSCHGNRHDDHISNENKPKSIIQFTGIDLEIKHEKQINIIEQVNQSIERWIPICITNASNSRPVSPASGCDTQMHNIVEREVSTIKLQTSHHVTLMFYSVKDRAQELQDVVTQEVLQQIGPMESDMQKLWESLTPYEFTVAMLYKRLYGIKYPFDKDHIGSTEDRCNDKVTVTMKHVIFVPGVLMCATAHLGRELVSIPTPDGTFGPYPDYPLGNCANMDSIIDQCTKGVMLEENHCTHVTLGVTKDYTAVFSNNVCQGVRLYLEYIRKYQKCSRKDKLWYIIKLMHDETAKQMEPRELLKILEIYTSTPSTLKHAKRQLMQLLPSLCNDEMPIEDEAKEIRYHTALPPIQKHPDELIELYKHTITFVSEDNKWIYIRHLPINKSLDATKDYIYVDAYVNSLDTTVTGSVRFF